MHFEKTTLIDDNVTNKITVILSCAEVGPQEFYLNVTSFYFCANITNMRRVHF